MVTHNSIAETESDPGAGILSYFMKRIINNPIAIAMGLTGAPVVAVGWHPYDMVDVGDGADGVIYDHAIDGAVASVETPLFADGYEYMIRWDNFFPSYNATLILSGHRGTDAAWSAVAASAASVPAHSGYAVFVLPMRAAIHHQVLAQTFLNDTTDRFGGIYYDIYDTTVQKITKAKIALGAGTTTAGKVFLYRRREYTTG